MNKIYTGSILFLLFFLASFQNNNLAQAPGTLDAQFGTGGSTQVAFLTFQSDCKAMAIQNDGKIILAGQYIGGGKGNMGFVRLNADGTPDNTFGTNGSVSVPFDNTNVSVVSVQVLPNGQIIAGGNSDGLVTILRMLANGTVDNSFGVNGVVQFSGDLNALTDLIILPGGKLAGCGVADQGNGKLFAAFRRNADGTADNTFGTNGFAYVNVGTQPSVTRMKAQTDGKLLLTGTVYVNNSTWYELVLLRFNTDGTPDAGFGTAGKVLWFFANNGGYELGNDLAIQPDGKIVVAGRIANSGPTVFTVVRFNANGTKDNLFGTNGAIKFNFYTSVDEAKALTIQPDGKILVAGTALNGSNRERAIARLTQPGARDASFATGGNTVTAIGTKAIGEAVALQPNGKIVVAGGATLSNLSRFSVARYHSGLVVSAPELPAGIESLSAFPNPARRGEPVVLRLELRENLNAQVQLNSLDGRLARDFGSFDLSAGAQELRLETPPDLPSGQYMLLITTDRGRKALPLMVRD